MDTKWQCCLSLHTRIDNKQTEGKFDVVASLTSGCSMNDILQLTHYVYPLLFFFFTSVYGLPSRNANRCVHSQKQRSGRNPGGVSKRLGSFPTAHGCTRRRNLAGPSSVLNFHKGKLTVSFCFLFVSNISLYHFLSLAINFIIVVEKNK